LQKYFLIICWNLWLSSFAQNMDIPYSCLYFNVSKGEREQLKAIAAKQGKSLNQYVIDAIDAYKNHK
jgi:hypothetical protein